MKHLDSTQGDVFMLRRPAGLAALLLGMLMAGCGVGGGQWTKPSADTTCDDWLNEMTEDQQADMAGPLFYSAVEAMGGDTSQLTDEVITDEVMDDITSELSQVCEDGSRLRTMPAAMEEALTVRVEQIFDDVGDALGD